MLKKIAFRQRYCYKNEEGARAPGTNHRIRTSARRFAGYAALLTAAGLGLSYFTQVKAESEESQSRTGLKIAPVPLNLQGKNVELVGYGSYVVNALSGCNGCHSAGPQTEYVPGGNPYFGQRPPITNPDVYLGGGRDFGQLIPGTANIVSRNLTPDKTGLPAGGRTYQEFRSIMLSGVDLDKVHPTCVGGPNSSCLLAPFDGTLLQINALAQQQQYERTRNTRNLRISEGDSMHQRAPCAEHFAQRLQMRSFRRFSPLRVLEEGYGLPVVEAYPP